MRKNVVAGLLLILSVVLFASPRSASAADLVKARIIVGDGTAASCTEPALQNALHTAELEGGGTIRFRCGADPVTIQVLGTGEELANRVGLHIAPAALTIPDNTTIDGGGLITLDASDPSTWTNSGATVVHIVQGRSVVLKGLTIANGCDGVFNEGTLVVRDSTVVDSRNCAAYHVSGVFNDGTLTVTNSTILRTGNPYVPGGGITNWGTATVDQSELINGRGSSAGALYNVGRLDVRNSVISGNRGNLVGGVYNNAILKITNTEFHLNGTDPLAGRVGALLNNSLGSLTIRTSTFSENNFGGIFNLGSTLTTIDSSAFYNNFDPASGGGWGGGGIYSEGPLTISKSAFSGNRAVNYGGAIHTTSTLTIKDSTITANTADINGGGIYVAGGIAPTLIRTSVTGNTPNDVVVVP